MRRILKTLLLLGGLLSVSLACPANSADYAWSNITGGAEYPPGYNYTVFVVGGWMVAMNQGSWLSNDGSRWVKTDLPNIGFNSAYQKYVLFNGAIYALGSLTGNYKGFSIATKISRTKDFNKWETLARTSNLPQRIFYGVAVFDQKIWMIGGYVGKNYLNDVWNSSDGVHWRRITSNAPWSPRNPGMVTVFKNKLWLLGGGEIDGEKSQWHNPQSEREVWTSEDGIKWFRVEANLKRKWRGTPVVFDDKLWVVGANRGGSFESASWFSADGRSWQEMSAPWSPRGAVAAWVFEGKLFLTGGKSSHTENGEIKFVYSNDVWAMSKKTE